MYGKFPQMSLSHALARLATAVPIPYTVRHGLAQGLKRQGGLGMFAPRRPLSTEEAFLANLDLTGQTVYDIGVYQGLYTLFFARAVGATGRVIGFEPLDANRAAAARNVALNRFAHVAFQPVALGAEVGTASFVIPDALTGETTGCAALQAKYQVDGRAMTMQTVRVVTLDSYLGTLPTPNLIKIDVEGMELDVLRGAVETLRTHRPALFIETHAVGAAGTNREAVRQALLEHGYRVVDVDRMHLYAH